MARTGRPRSFDEQQVLERARDVFWSNGYAATSIQDLVDALEVQRGSLYAAFGDKRRLYLKAVQLYARENRESLERILQADPLLPALRSMLLDPAYLTGTPAPTGPTRGCLVGNTTAELVPQDDTARAVAAAAYDGFIAVAAAALARAQANGEVVDTATPEAQAELLLTLFQGAALVARASGRSRLNAGIEFALDSLRSTAPR